MLKVVLFDFDGVILDSFKFTVRAYQQTMLKFCESIPTRNQVRSLYGLNAHAGLRQLLPTATDEYIDLLFEQFKKESDSLISQTKLFAGAYRVISDLWRTHKLAIVSSRRSHSVNTLLIFHKLEAFFAGVVGREDVTHHKPHPEPLLKALAILRVTPSEAIYVGDMPEDVLAARAAKVPSIFIAGKRTEQHGADYVVKRIGEIPDMIYSLYKERTNMV